MEVVCFRFPHLGMQILENIDDISFTECRKLSPSMCNFIDGTKSISRRILQTYLPDTMDVRKILRSSNSKTLEAFSYLVQDEFLRYGYNTSLVLELITSKAKDKNPVDRDGWTPFLKAAKHGHIEVCNYFIENLEDINPRNIVGLTPYHKAAEYGHLSICKLFIENLDDKNPKSDHGRTPLHEAAENGHIEVCQLIIENIDDKNPMDDFGWTPLHGAVNCGHLEVCKLITQNNIKDTDTKDSTGQTPIHLAEMKKYQSVHEYLTIWQELTLFEIFISWTAAF